MQTVPGTGTEVLPVPPGAGSQGELETDEGAATLDPDAREAAEGELTRIDLAQHFDPQAAPAVPERSYQQPAPLARGYAGDRAERPRPEPRETSAPDPELPFLQAPQSKTPQVLEDLYRMFPEIGNGVTRLRVERKAPKVWRGQNISGWLEDLDDQISIEQFKERFGGHQYLVSVIGPTRTRGKDSASGAEMGILASVKVDISASPAIGSTPQQLEGEEEYMLRTNPSFQPRQGASGPIGYLPMPPDSAVEIKKLELQGDREKREAEERAELQRRSSEYQMAAGSTPDSVISSITAQADRTVTEVKEQSNMLVDALRKNGDELRVRLVEQDKELRILRDEIVRVKTEAAEAIRNGETKLVSETKERYAQEMSALNQRHAKDVDELKDRYNRDINELKERGRSEFERLQTSAKVELDSLRTQYETRLTEASRTNAEKLNDERSRTSKEMETARTDYRERAEMMKNDYMRLENTLREEQKSRIAELERANEREIRSIKDAAERDVSMMRSQTSNESKLTERTTALQIQASKSEVERLEARLERAETENRELQRKVNKSVPEAIQEAHALAGMTGMVSKEEDAAQPAEGSVDLKTMGLKLGMALLEKAPDLLKVLRDQNAAQAAARQLPPQPQARQVVAAPQTPQMVRQQPGQQTQQRRVAPPPGMGGPLPQPGWNQAPSYVPPAPGTMHGVPAPFQGAPPPMASPGMRQVASFGHATPGPAGVPAQVGHAQPPAISPLQPQQAQPPASAQATDDIPTQWMPTPGASQPPPAAPAVVRAAPLPEGGDAEGAMMMQEFVQELNNAILSKVVPPGMFAQGFIARVGDQTARKLLETMPAEQFLEALGNIPGAAGLQVVTREGHKYVHAVWDAGSLALGLTPA